MFGQEHFAGPGLYRISGAAPSNGTDEVQTLTVDGTVTAGTFRLSFEGFVSAAIAWDAATAAVETALNNLKSLGAGGTATAGVAVTGGAFPGTAFTVTFSGTNVAKKAQGLLVLHTNSLTGGGTVVIEEGTPGVDATHRMAPQGALLIREHDSNVRVYQNIKAAAATVPTWSVVGTQS